MNKFIKIGLLLFLPTFCKAQTTYLDSLTNAFKSASVDSVRYQTANKLVYYFENTNSDSANYYIETELLLARRNKKSWQWQTH